MNQEDGSRGSWMPSPLIPDTALDLLGAEAMESVDDLRLIRKALGWSQPTMADFAETPVSTYRKWEQEQRRPPAYIPRLIIRLLIAEGVLTREQVDDIIGVD